MYEKSVENVVDDMSCRDTLLQIVHETLQTMERELKLVVDFT